MELCGPVLDLLGSTLKYYFFLYLLFLAACALLIPDTRLAHVSAREARRLQARFFLLNLEEVLPAFSRSGRFLIHARKWGFVVLALLTILYPVVNQSCLPS